MRWGCPCGRISRLAPAWTSRYCLPSRALALAEFDAPEVMANTLIHPDRPIENPRRLKRAVYEISGEGLSDVDRDDVPTAGFQVVEWIDEDTMRITIDLGFQTPGPGLGDDEERYLAASNALDHEDEAIAALVEQAGRAAAIAKVPTWMRFRRRRVAETSSANLSMRKTSPSASPPQAKSHAPAKATAPSTVVYLPPCSAAQASPAEPSPASSMPTQFIQQNDIFGYHMWTQAWIETADGQGVWIDLDAAFPGQINGFDATHIALSTSAQSDDDFTNDMVAMLPMMRGDRSQSDRVGMG